MYLRRHGKLLPDSCVDSIDTTALFVVTFHLDQSTPHERHTVADPISTQIYLNLLGPSPHQLAAFHVTAQSFAHCRRKSSCKLGCFLEQLWSSPETYTFLVGTCVITCTYQESSTKRYPIPASVMRYRGLLGSGSNFFRSCEMYSLKYPVSVTCSDPHT